MPQGLVVRFVLLVIATMDIQEINVSERKYPFYLKATVILFGLILFFFVLHILASVFIPLAMACLIAILLNPLCNRLQKKMPRGIAIMIVLFMTIALVSLVVYFYRGRYLCSARQYLR